MADALKTALENDLFGKGEVLLDCRTPEDVERMHAGNGMRLILIGLNRNDKSKMRIGAIVLQDLARSRSKDN